MANSSRYDALQWAFMNLPETQAKLRRDLYDCLRRFLDTAPEGKPLERATELLVLMKRYFENELERLETGRPDDLERIEQSGSLELVVQALDGALLMIPTDEKRREILDGVLHEFEERREQG